MTSPDVLSIVESVNAFHNPLSHSLTHVSGNVYRHRTGILYVQEPSRTILKHYRTGKPAQVTDYRCFPLGFQVTDIAICLAYMQNEAKPHTTDPDRNILLDVNDLALEIAASHGWTGSERFLFDSEDAVAQRFWRDAVIAYEHITSADIASALVDYHDH